MTLVFLTIRNNKHGISESVAKTVLNLENTPTTLKLRYGNIIEIEKVIQKQLFIYLHINVIIQ